MLYMDKIEEKKNKTMKNQTKSKLVVLSVAVRGVFYYLQSNSLCSLCSEK